MTIAILHQQGVSKKGIARQLGISVNTVKRYLRMDANQKAGKAKLSWQKLAPYFDYVYQRMSAAAPDKIPATVLYRELLAQGYQGKLRQVTYYVAQQYRLKTAEPIIRFETPPGKQMQVDWIEFSKGKHRLAAFVATLGYSRVSYVEFVTDEQLATFIRCHEHAFAYFGGVPYQALYDNMKTVVIARDAYGEGKHCFQKGFWDFAKHYGFLPKLCQPYRAKTKGKVERFNRYLRYSFYVPLLSKLKASGIVLDKATANYEVRQWLDKEANQRCHGTTNKIPWQELLVEQQAMMHLPMPYTGKIIAVAENNLIKTTPTIPFVPQRALATYDRLLEVL